MAKAKEQEQVNETPAAGSGTVTRIKKASVQIEGNTLTIDFEGAGSSVINADELSDEIRHQLMLHGMKQKVCDSYSGVRGQEAEDSANAVIEQLKAGNWTVQRSSGEGTVRVTMLAEAIAKLSGKPLEEITAKLQEMGTTEEGKEKLKLLRQDSQVKQVIAEIKLAQAKKEAKEAGGSDLSTIFA